MAASSLEQVVNLAKRRGFVFQSSEIYGGAAAAYDYGPLGVELKNGIKRLWWEDMTRRHDNIVGLDAAIFMHPKVWEASGHVESFSDTLVECKNCHRRFRDDERANDAGACPACGAAGQFTEPRRFSTMFTTHLGPTEEAGATIYLRPETAQGIYVNAPLVAAAMRLQVPFGIAQIGKAFRNEVTPGNFTFRTVEFEQMEMQYFVRPEGASAAFAEWKERRQAWYGRLGFSDDALRLREHAREELPHYARAAVDVEFRMPFGWKEIEGIHNRGDWDLTRHQRMSGKDLSFFDARMKERFLPWVVETSAGVDRVFLALLVHAYHEEEAAGETRVVLKVPRALAPVQVAVFPLLSNDERLVGKARGVAGGLREAFRIQVDAAGSIGRRYRRQDEIGTPFCVTVDHQTLADDTVTIRDRDTMEQTRAAAPALAETLADALRAAP